MSKEPNSALPLARQLDQAFVDVAARVSPAVAVISVVQKISGPVSDDGADDGSFEALPPGFWRNFHEQFKRSVPEKTRGEGSGIIFREDGYILTNTHVVDEAESIEVRLQDGRSFKATVRGSDPQSDLAVLKIDARNLPVARLGDSSKARVGEFAIAIGAPFSLEYTVTFGHISAKDRSNVIQGFDAAAMDQDFIQTDAPINPGNSGGPLLNIDGEVIGVVTLIRGLHSGIGFAIPSNLAKEIAEHLIADGKFTRLWLGIGIRGVREDPDFAQTIKGIDDGVIVASILADGPAAKTGLRASDVITTVDGKRVSTSQQLRAEIRGKKPGQSVTLEVFRQGKTFRVKVNPAERLEPVPAATKAKHIAAPDTEPTSIGVTVQNFTSDLADKFGLDLTEGVVVSAVEKNSLAARKGLQPGDVITAINQQPVATPRQFREALQRADLKKGLVVNLLNSNSARFEILKAEP